MMPLSSRGFGVARLVLAGALSVSCGAMVLAQQKKGDQKPDPAAVAQQQAQNQEVETVVHAADAAMSGAQTTAGEVPITVQADFLKAQSGRVWVPLTMTFDSAKTAGGPVALYLRVTPRGMTAPPAAPAPEPANAKDNKKKNDKDKKDPKSAAAPPPSGPSYPYEDVAFIDLKAAPGQPLRVQRGIGVPPGSYDLYVVLHERAPAGKLGVLKQPLDVPNFTTGDLQTSSIILAQHVNQLTAPVPADQQSEHPYAFGQTEIVVSPERKFKKTDELIVLFQVYNANISADKKFSLEATYTFYKQDAGTEKRFNSTEPQPLNNDTMPPGFDPTNPNASIQAGQGIPLQSFPEGTYRLEIKVTDKQSTKVLTQNTTFTVTP
jgi:hypothetical protein